MDGTSIVHVGFQVSSEMASMLSRKMAGENVLRRTKSRVWLVADWQLEPAGAKYLCHKEDVASGRS